MKAPYPAMAKVWNGDESAVIYHNRQFHKVPSGELGGKLRELGIECIIIIDGKTPEIEGVECWSRHSYPEEKVTLAEMQEAMAKLDPIVFVQWVFFYCGQHNVMPFKMVYETINQPVVPPPPEEPSDEKYLAELLVMACSTETMAAEVPVIANPFRVQDRVLRTMATKMAQVAQRMTTDVAVVQSFIMFVSGGYDGLDAQQNDVVPVVAEVKIDGSEKANKILTSLIETQRSLEAVRGKRRKISAQNVALIKETDPRERDLSFLN